MIKGEFNTIGKIIKLSGHSGELIISSDSLFEKSPVDVPLFLLLEGEYVPFFIEEVKPINHEKAVVQLEGVRTERKASKLIGKSIFQLNDGKKKKKNNDDIIGWQVTDANFGKMGVVAGVDLNPQNPLLIVNMQGKEIFVPFQEEFILGMDPKEKSIMLECPPGLIDLYLQNE